MNVMESRPKPINTDFTSNTSSNKATIGILPPPYLTHGMGSLPNVFNIAAAAAFIFWGIRRCHCWFSTMVWPYRSYKCGSNFLQNDF